MTCGARAFSPFFRTCSRAIGRKPRRQGPATGTWALDVVDIRNFATDRHRSVDDRPPAAARAW